MDGTAPIFAELVDDQPFFAPTPAGLFDGLMGEYTQARRRIAHVASFMAADGRGVVNYFLDGNISKNERLMGHRIGHELFQAEGAVKALDADFWQRALSLTDVYNCMPQARREQWNDAIREHKAPEFTEDTVRTTIQDLLDARQQFFAERIDGIFRGLSRNHVTNRPQGFAQRMIMEWVFNDWGSVSSERAGVINDLRVVIARFMGRDEPRWTDSDGMLRACREDPGVWHVVDGGSLRVRVYKKGTAHLEVHPDIAWRLNAMLAHLYPQAIPAEHRTRPERRVKAFATLQRPLPFAVVREIAHLRGDGRARCFDYGGDVDKHVRAETIRVLEALGAVIDIKNHRAQIQFDYAPSEVLAEVVRSGCLPDKVSHQFYPTPHALARRVVAAAAIAEGDRVLEPSAGQGALAAEVPAGAALTCVELSGLHASILRGKGYEVQQADFLEWSKRAFRTPSRRFEAIVMNPPFSQGRARAHLEAAATLLAPGGRLSAIVPASMAGKDLPGLTCTWSTAVADAFADASVTVVLLLAERPAA